VNDIAPDREEFFDEGAREAADSVLRQAFVAAQIGMPSDDFETAVETLWIIVEAMLVDHFSPGSSGLEGISGRSTTLDTHWRRLVTTAVTHTFVLSGDFVMPDEMLAAVEERAGRLEAGEFWHTRRPPAQGALILGVHGALLHLERTAVAGRYPDKDDSAALVEIIALATLGAVMARGGSGVSVVSGESTPAETGDPEPKGRWARSTGAVAESFGIGGVGLVSVQRHGWECDECGCIFLGRVEGGIAYPDRMAPVGRGGPCDSVTTCACHEAPLQRRVR
jgi:hypothetical protein